MKYINNFKTRRQLADHERTLDVGGWYTVIESDAYYRSIASEPSGVTWDSTNSSKYLPRIHATKNGPAYYRVTVNDNPVTYKYYQLVVSAPVSHVDTTNYYTLSQLTEDFLANSNYTYFRVGTSSDFVYMRKVAKYMLWMVDAYRKDDNTASQNSVGFYIPMGIIPESGTGAAQADFLFEDFNQDFFVPQVAVNYQWTSVGSVPVGYTFMEGYKYLEITEDAVPYTTVKTSSTFWDNTNSGADLPLTVTADSPEYYRVGTSPNYHYFVLTHDEDTAVSLESITPAVIDDYPYMRVSGTSGYTFYRKDVVS